MQVTNSSLRKLPRSLECPPDNVFLDISEKLLPFFRATGHTPNILTFYALICTYLCGYFLHKKDIVSFAIAFNAGYLFDCMDGMFARKYHMTSKFGDLFEHARDIIGNGILNIYIWHKYKAHITPNVMGVYGILLAGTALHIGCQQKYLTEKAKERGEKVSKESIDMFAKLCPKGLSPKWTKWLGAGTYTLGFVGLVWYVHNKSKSRL